jgi:hypothetical protein
MELVALLRLLWRHRRLVAIGLAIATALALVMAPGRSETFAVASGRVVVDTPHSQLLNAGPTGADTLPWRARMLADLTGSQPVTNQIARGAGIPAKSLVAVVQHLTVPEVATPLSVSALEAGEAGSQPHVVAVGLSDERLPIISIDTRAPDRAGAARLVTATVNALRGLASGPNAGAGLQTLLVESMGPALTKDFAGASGRLARIGTFGGAFGLWCIGMALVLGIRRIWRHGEWPDHPAWPSGTELYVPAGEPRENGRGQRVV